MERSPNRLISETSPYLLQHAYNPVQWFPWCIEAFEKAKREDKLILISIGYSACHWCHVMEHESFEDQATAEIMNKFFVCIKVDREERPDIDQVYMNAVQLMSGQGGWPLNCFVIPEGKPVYGGTYFPNEHWKKVLYQLHGVWKDDREKVLDYAERLTEGVQLSELVKAPKEIPVFTVDFFSTLIQKWKSRLDHIEGGPNRAPKFPLPNNYLFLLRYAVLQKDELLLAHVDLTLKKMAMGGIYDQLGGGIMRYSTDMIWKVPHFEKMLYDNAQILSLYAEAFRHYKKELYKETVYSVVSFCERELKAPGGGFYSALDADSEGEEGKYYTWTKQELQNILGEEFGWFEKYYEVNYLGEWEHGNYILLRREEDKTFAQQQGFSIEEFRNKKNNAHRKLLKVREQRVRPGLDNKQLCSWNAMFTQGLCDAYKSFGDRHFLELALETGHFIMSDFLRGDGGLNRVLTNGKIQVNAFLEDYAFTIEAFLSLYEISADENWLKRAEKFTQYCVDHFLDTETGMFFYTSDLDPALIVRKTELGDNVVPASNSTLARCLFTLSVYSAKTEYRLMAEKMMAAILPLMPEYGAGYSNWGILLLNLTHPIREIVVCGEHAKQQYLELHEHYLPDCLICYSESESDLPLLKNRFKNGETLIYICHENNCKLPVAGTTAALEQLQ